MTDADIAKLSSIPWAAALINDTRWTPTLSYNRSPKPTGEDSFFAETLDTSRTIRAILTLKPTKEAEGGLPYNELLVILDLGDGLNGYPQVLHGGFAATLLDETCGGLIQLNMFEKAEKLGSYHATSYLTACRPFSCTGLSVSRLTRVLQT
jgi:thioesterase superfamily protein 4